MDKTRSKSWMPAANRFVVFLDIMGFKNFVSRNTHETVYDELHYLSQIKDVLDKASREVDSEVNSAKIYTTSFSDSIIMFSKDDTITCFQTISFLAALFIKRAIERNIPIKGGIAYGKVTVNKSRQIFFGQPLIDAFEMEEDMHYYGIAAHHSIDDFLNIHKDEIDPWTENVLYKEIETPLKCGKIKHYNINWFESIPVMTGKSKLKQMIQPDFHRILHGLKTRTSGAPRRYIDNTEKVFHLMYPDLV